MCHFTAEAEPVLAEGAQLRRDGEAAVMAQLHRIGAFYVGHRVDERGTGVFFICQHIAADLHANKALFRQRMRRKSFEISFKALDIAAVLLDLLRKVFHKLIFQPELLALMVCFQQLELAYIHIQIHALFDAGVTGAERLDLGKGQGGFVHVLAGAHRGFAGHDLRNEPLLGLQRLPEIGVEGAFRHIAADMNGLVSITLPFDAAFALRQITRPPRGVQIMQRDQAILHVSASAHFGGAAHQNAHLAGTDFRKEVTLFGLSIRLVNKGDLLRGHPACNQLLPDILIDGKVRLRRIQRDHVLQSVDLRAVQRAARRLGLFRLRGGEVAKDKLGQLLVLAIPPIL